MDNFETFYDLLVQAVADALEVLASQVTLSLEDPEELDRQDVGLRVFATVLAVGLEKEEEILMKMKSDDMKTDINTEIEKKPALKEAGARLKSVTEPIARVKTTSSGPEVQMPGRDVMLPEPQRPPSGMITLQQLGQPCGPCMCPPTYTMGECERHLECVHNPFIADAPGKCMERGN